MITTLFAVMNVLSAAPAPAVDADKFLHAVEQVAQAHKTPLGPYDITEPVWRDRAPKHWPYGRARVEKYARVVAKDHLRWLADGLVRAGLEPDVYALGACWRLGLEGGKKAIRAGARVDYAAYVRNIYYLP